MPYDDDTAATVFVLDAALLARHSTQSHPCSSKQPRKQSVLSVILDSLSIVDAIKYIGYKIARRDRGGVPRVLM